MLKRRAGSVRFAASLLLTCVAACSSKATPSSDANDADLPSAEVSCTADPRVDNYVAGMQKPGNLGALSFQLSQSTPAPPANGANTFVMQVSDASGAPADVGLAVDLIMPDHGHGSSVVPAISFDADSQAFTVAPLYFFMPGVWRIDFTANSDANASKPQVVDTASFFFCVEG